jgi:hypothetical protein
MSENGGKIPLSFDYVISVEQVPKELVSINIENGELSINEHEQCVENTKPSSSKENN